MFCWVFFLGEEYHNQRIEFINELISNLSNKNYKISIYGNHNVKLFEEPYRTRYKHITDIVNNPIFGLDMYKVLANSKITLNMHIDVAGKYAGNMRLFEATGVGSCLVTDWKENIMDLFVPDKEVICYKDVNECVEKIEWLLNNEEERKKIAQQGQLRTLNEHNFTVRAKQLNNIIKSYLP